MSLGSSATAILKTTSGPFYESTILVDYKDSDMKLLNSRGGLFYAMGEDEHYQHKAIFETKYKNGSYYETYAQEAHMDVSINGGNLVFKQGQGLVSGSGNLKDSLAVEEFNLTWKFEVLNEDASLGLFMEFSSGMSTFVFTDLSLETTDVFDSNTTETQNLFLKKGNQYQLDIVMSNSSYSDGIENYISLGLNNAIFPIPAPNNILILLLALIALVPLRKSLK